MASQGAEAAFRSLPNNTNKYWWKDSGLRKIVMYNFGCMLCPFYLGYDQSLLTGLQSLPEWNKFFDNPSAAWICSAWGRKWCVLIGASLIVVGGVWKGLSTSTSQFMGARIVMGAGGGMTKVAAPALLHESAHPRLRPPMGHMYYGFYHLGSLISSIMCIVGLYIEGEWSWRLPCLLIIVGPTSVILLLAMGPESPRFHVSKGQNQKALATLAKYHANGALDDPLVNWEYQEIQIALEEEILNRKSSYLDFFRTQGNRKRLAVSLAIAFIINWAGNGIVSYYLTPALKMIGIYEPVRLVSINAGLSAWNLIISEISGLNIDKFGRRTLFLVSTTGMMLSYCVVMGLSAGFAKTNEAAMGVAAIPFLFIFYGFYDMAWTPLNYCYCVEIMPFNLRAKGTAIHLTAQSLANAFNQFANPLALAAISWRYYAVYIAIDFCYIIIIYLWFPETRNLTIEEVSLVFDYGVKHGGKRAVAAMAARMRSLEEGPVNKLTKK
ncbi:Hexose transporter protein [Pleurostoma richardsiae]|uniref:Hexose transporter protein n=1 Tax=Pleurostoma richardsiae TaxID=41990 RepID=A0AA38SBI8_9PEZI|nr:Hexose transporter protein [Pleurostoma richardsiae]